MVIQDAPLLHVLAVDNEVGTGESGIGEFGKQVFEAQCIGSHVHAIFMRRDVPVGMDLHEKRHGFRATLDALFGKRRDTLQLIRRDTAAFVRFPWRSSLLAHSADLEERQEEAGLLDADDVVVRMDFTHCGITPTIANARA